MRLSIKAVKITKMQSNSGSIVYSLYAQNQNFRPYEHLKCYFDQKLTPIFFFHKSKVLIFNTYHAKLQVFMSTKSVINWAIISGFGRPPLQNSYMAGNNWESLGERGSDVIQSRQQKQFGYFSMGQVSSWKVFAVVFYEYDRNSNWTRPCMTRVCQLVVVLCRIATTVPTREKEFLSIILLPAALFYHFGRDSCPHITRTST